MCNMLKNARRINIHAVRREKLLVDSNMGGIGPCLLLSHDAKALDFAVLYAVVVRFVFHVLIWAAVF